ncbi:MAG: O-antigen polymerase [Litorilinea sp.]|nr:MAG: O-antigen polymerase [Litorilinea sp.]
MVGLAALVALAAGLAWFPLAPVALAAGGAGVAFGLVRHPWLIWVLLAAALPVTSGQRVGPATLTDLLLALAVGLWLADGSRRRRLRLEATPPVYGALLYIGALSISLWAAPALGEAVREVVKWLEFVAVLLVIRDMVPAGRAPWLVGGLLVGGLGQGLLGLYQFYYGIGPEWFIILGRFMRASGSFRQPNPYAGYLGLTLPLAVSLALWAWRRLWLEPGWASWLWAGFYSAAAGIVAAGLMASWSRGGWLGAAAGLLVVVALRSARTMMATAVATAGLALALLVGSLNPTLLPPSVTQRFADIPASLGLTDVLQQPLTDENFAVVERVAHWVAALRMWERAPWLGVGPGNYSVVYPAVRLPLWEDPLGHAHNIYLNVLGETGLLGLTAYLALWLVVAHWLWQRRQAALAVGDEEGWQAALALGLLGMLAHLTVHNVFDNLFVQGMYVHIAIGLATLNLARPDTSKTSLVNPGRNSPIGSTQR